MGLGQSTIYLEHFSHSHGSPWEYICNLKITPSYIGVVHKVEMQAGNSELAANTPGESSDIVD